jgi:hypothetical protein
MPDRLNLKQFGQLVPDDLLTHPVWVSCHSVDVACEFTMVDGSRHQGFATPALEPDGMGVIQPQIFSLSGKRHAFWLGMFPRQEEITGFYTDFAKGPSSVLPLTFSALPGLTTAFCSGVIQGFMASSGGEVRLIT